MPRLLALVFVTFLVVSSAGLAAADTLGRPELSVHLPDNRLEVGEETSLDLFVLNGGVIHQGGPRDAETRVTTARQVLVTVRDRGAPLTVETRARPVGNVPEGVVGPITFAVTVDEDAESGTYELPVSVDYVYTRRIDTDDDDDEPAHFQTSDRLDTTVEVELEARADFELSDVTSTLKVGDEGQLRGTVTNTGGMTVTNAVVVFSSENTNVVPVESEYAIGDLAPGEAATFEFTADVSDSADAGPRQLSISVRYRDDDNEVRRSDPLDARVDVGPRRDRFAVEPLSGSLEAGTADVLELRVTNTGDEPVSDVSAKLFTDDPLASTDDEAFIDELGPGDSAVVKFGLTAGNGALAKVYPASLDFQYEDADGDTRLSNTYKVPVEVTVSQDRNGPTVAVIRERPLVAGAVAGVVLLLIGGIWYWRRR
jgi:hypothetical protein